MGILSIIQLVLPLLQGVLAMLTKSNAPAEVLGDVQAAIDSLTKVHGTLVTKAQVDSLLVEPKW